jgi:hypothetical protein
VTNEPLTVAFAHADASTRSGHAAALATLPGSFRLVGAPPADVLVTTAAGAGWPTRVTRLLAAPTRALVLAAPKPADQPAIAELAAAAARQHVIVAVDSPYADSEAWQDALPALRADLAGLAFIDSVITAEPPAPAGSAPGAVHPLASGLVDQLAVIESLAGQAGNWAAASVSASHYVVHGDAGGVSVSLSGVACSSPPSTLELDLVGADARWHIGFGSVITARPVLISRFDADGTVTRRPLFQNARRSAWVRLHEAVTAATPYAEPLERLGDRVARASQLLGSGVPS